MYNTLLRLSCPGYSIWQELCLCLLASVSDWGLQRRAKCITSNAIPYWPYLCHFLEVWSLSREAAHLMKSLFFKRNWDNPETTVWLHCTSLQSFTADLPSSSSSSSSSPSLARFWRTRKRNTDGFSWFPEHHVFLDLLNFLHTEQETAEMLIHLLNDLKWRLIWYVYLRVKESKVKMIKTQEKT